MNGLKGMKGKAWVWMTTKYRNQCKNTTLNVNVKRKFDKAEQNIHSLVRRWWFWFKLMTSRLLPFVSYYLFYIFYISLGSLLNTFAVNVSCAKLVTSFQAERSVQDECSVFRPLTKMWVVMFSFVCFCLFTREVPVQGPDPHPTSQTCSNLFTMKHRLSASGWLACDWNTFVYCVFLDCFVFKVRLHLRLVELFR